MKRKTIRFISLLLLCILALAGCNKNSAKSGTEDVSSNTAVSLTPSQTPRDTENTSSTPGNFDFSEQLKNTMAKEDYPVVDGSTATIPLSEAVYRLATGATAEEASANIVHTKTSNSYYRLMNREADLLIVYAPSDSVMKDIEKSSRKLIMKPIGKDALIFMANASNPVQSLTTEQLIDIYSGKLTNWQEVGGDNKEIIAYQRPEESGSQALMKKLVMKKVPMMTGPKAITFDTMGSILEAMVNYRNEGNTLGYSVFYYADNMYRLPELKFMKVNNVEPSLQTIYDNTYPFVNEFYAVIREEESNNSNARKIFDWLTSEEGQTLVRDLGYVPIAMEVKDTSVNEVELKADRLPEGYRYVGTSYVTGGGLNVGTVTIYDPNWEASRVLQNTYSYKSGLLPEEELLPIGVSVYQDDGNFVLKYGLYDMKTDTFVIPVEYEMINILDEDKGYYIIREAGVSRIVDKQNKVLVKNLGKGEMGFNKYGDYYWITSWGPEGAIEVTTIYNLNFEIVKKFDKDYTSSELYHENGEVYFSREVFNRKVLGREDYSGNFYLRSFTSGEPLISVSYEDELMVLNEDMKIIAQKPGSQDYNSYFNVYYDIYSDSVYDTYNFVEKGIFYDRTGKEIKGKKGNTYSNIVYENYWRSGENHEQILYSMNDDKLNILNYQTGEEIGIDIEKGEKIGVFYVYGDLVFVTVEGKIAKTRVYKGNQILFEWNGYYSVDSINNPQNLQKGVLLIEYGADNDSEYVIVGKSGELLYESYNKEQFIQIDDKYIQLVRGNYWGVMDYEQSYIVKTIRENMGND